MYGPLKGTHEVMRDTIDHGLSAEAFHCAIRSCYEESVVGRDAHFCCRKIKQGEKGHFISERGRKHRAARQKIPRATKRAR